MRVVDNFVNGYGLVWNTDERVQAYTHPLWLLLLSPIYFVIREPYYVLLAVSAVLSVGAVVLVLRAARTASLVLLAGILLTGSKAFVDFSTSGLENPLSHLLVAAFSLLYIRARWQATVRYNVPIAALAGLTILNRFDFALLVLPAVVERILSESTWSSRIRLAAIALSPAALWMVFSLFYYGFPLPNTFYAKQTAGMPRAEYLERGVAYVVRLIAHDPLTFALIAVSLVLAFMSTQRSMLWSLGLGMLAYSGYTIWIGGDFMEGRFLSAAFVMGVALVICALDGLRSSVKVNLSLGSAAFILGLLTIPVPNWLSGYPYPPQQPLFLSTSNHPLYALVQHLNYPRLFTFGHVSDERSTFFSSTSLLAHLHTRSHIEDFWASQFGRALKEGRTRVTVHGMLGFTGFYAGPAVRIIDFVALSDAFIARMPHQEPDDWKIGHIHRLIPDGYVSSRIYGDNRLSNDKLKQLYEDIRRVTQGALLSWERAEAIVRLNLFPTRVTLDDLQPPARDLVHNQANKQLYAVPTDGLLIYTQPYSRTLPHAMLFLADSCAAYQIVLTNDWGDLNATTTVTAPACQRQPIQGLSARLVEVNAPSDRYFNVMLVKELSPAPSSRFGYLRLLTHTSRLSSEQTRLLGAGVTLSTAIGLAPQFSAPLPIVLQQMAGAWYSKTGIDRLELQLHPVSCQQQTSPWEALLIINGSLVHEFKWDSANCQQISELSTVLNSPPLKQGWNLIELHTSHPTSIAVKSLRLYPTSSEQ
ncbi:MAG: hypothetical protein RMM31_08185, partial [Anaerolineae bacterium]|nr:hypothetical protein [Anaerolineae bacterium]